ncbi:unnamed protein product, partial [marine sediment metagenome]
SIIPTKLSTYLGINEGFWKDIIGSAYLFFLLPVILWILSYLLFLSTRLRLSLMSYLKNFSIIFIPVIATFYIGLVVMEVVTKFPYYKYIIHDITGVETTKAILFKQIVVVQLPQWTDWAFFLILILALIIGVIISYKVISKLLLKYKIQKNKRLLYILPFIFILIYFFEVLLYQSF